MNFSMGACVLNAWGFFGFSDSVRGSAGPVSGFTEILSKFSPTLVVKDACQERSRYCSSYIIKGTKKCF